MSINRWIDKRSYLFKSPFSVILGTHEKWSCWIISYFLLIFWGITILLLTMAALFYICSNDVKVFQFLHILNIFFFLCVLFLCVSFLISFFSFLLDNSHLNGYKIVSHCGLKDWCWSWNSNTLATWCQELNYWKRPWWWERVRIGREGGW